MKITILGSGTSGGVPMINCQCSVCRSVNPKNKRLRSSILIEVNGKRLLVDTTPDFRQQMLRYPVPRLDAVLYTHTHADHIMGLDDLRRFNYLQKETIPIYGNAATIAHLQTVFGYAIYQGGPIHPGVPHLLPQVLDGVQDIQGVEVIPIPLMHGQQEILGYRVGNFAYCTDVSEIQQSSYPLLENLDVLILEALRDKPHPNHLTLKQAVEQAKKINAKQTWFTHISHILDEDVQGKNLPVNMAFAYDGLQIEL